ncbi:MAG: hypothetical protein IJ491_09760 [Clostridia bacterium]|nr:hypothetical protein [Clostridia bacterium]
MATKYSSGAAWKAYNKNEKNKPKAFSYNQKKPTFSYDSTDINKYYDELLNRKDFSFDLDKNALFNQYKDAYSKQGQLAMMDTMGQASALTGGYGNSYAASAGQQAYQQNLDKLNDVVPEIYQLALEQYQLEGQNLLDKYSLAAEERDTAYGQYRDQLSDYYTDRDFSYGQYRDEVGDYQTDRDYLYGVYADSRDYEYQQSRDKISDSQWQKEYDLQVKEFTEQVRQFEKEYSLSEKEFDEMVRQFALEHDLNVKQFNEDVRQYNTSLQYTKQQDAVQNSQWAKEFEEEQRQYNESKALSEKELAEEQRQYDADLKEKQRQFDTSVLVELGLLSEENAAQLGENVDKVMDYFFGGKNNSTAGETDAGYGGWKGSGSNGEWAEADDAAIENFNEVIERDGIINDKTAMKRYLNEWLEDGSLTLAQYNALKDYYKL